MLQMVAYYVPALRREEEFSMLETLGVLRDISLLFMCLLPSLVAIGVGIYIFFFLRPWTKIDTANQKYVVANIRKGVELTQKADSTTYDLGKKVISPLISAYSAAAAASAFINVLFGGTDQRASRARQATRLAQVRAERIQRMTENTSEEKIKQQSPSPTASTGRVDPYGQQPSAPSLPRTSPGSVDETVDNMVDTAGANPMYTPNQPGDEIEDEDSRSAPPGTTAAGLIEPAAGMNQIDGVITSERARQGTSNRPPTDRPADRFDS